MTNSLLLKQLIKWLKMSLVALHFPSPICPDVLVDGVTYQVPMVTEEPSVVAAASYASKLIKRSGGFTTKIHDRQMIWASSPL